VINIPDHFDFTRLSRIPRWVHFLWACYFLLIFLCAFQELSHLFYGPTRSVQGDGMRYHCDVSRGWADTLLYLPIGFAWFVFLCARKRLAAIFVVLGLSAFLLCGSAMIHESNLPGSGSHGWRYNGVPATAILGFEPVVEFVADPAGEVWFFINLLLILAWTVGVIVWQGFYHYPLLPPGGVCRECEYDLRGSPTMQCPECGCENRSPGLTSE
jgi:hypothetical protein